MYTSCDTGRGSAAMVAAAASAEVTADSTSTMHSAAGSACQHAERQCQSFRILLTEEGAPWWPSTGATCRERHLELPRGSTIGQARQCLGHPARGTMRALLVPALESLGQTTAGVNARPPEEREVADDMYFWEISRGCRAELKLAPEDVSASPNDWAAVSLSRRLQQSLHSVWSTYKSMGPFFE
eukprot:CAMPEP_0171227864 /NCGR_PEP_ID=MMETSP0790-20130122/38066_1 /TAXON_ID=2925 /ORGANISM="Alexandrium catenella, Strain OF101" /LENGTH=183 /DNA_ID=CAMNT_0011693989 /DNA_START=21 /DNA_END=572 /DNA_ORIENTATION=-